MGNPFFLRQFLYNLYEADLIHFDLTHKRWFWDVLKITQREFTANVILFMTERLTEMGDAAKELAKAASCFGNTFSLANLAGAVEQSPKDVAEGLWPLLKARILYPKNSNYDLIQDWAGAVVVYGFSHDRIQQAAYGLLGDEDKAGLHLKIARLLENQDTDIYQIVNHYSKADPSHVDRDELLKIINMNIGAARKARSAGAYDIAVDLLEVSIRFISLIDPEDAKPIEYSLYFETGQCHYLIGNIDTGEEYLDKSLAVAASNIDKAKVLSQKVNLYINLSQVDRALEIGIRSLELVGVKLSKNPSKLHVVFSLLKTKFRLNSIDIERLGERPLMTDEKSKTAIEVLVNLLVSVYSASPELFADVILKIVNISLSKGNHPMSTYGYGGFGAIQAVGFKKYDDCFRFGQALLNVSEQFDSKLTWGRAHFQVGALIWHWGRHARESLDHLKTASRFGVESGDYLNVALTTINLIWTRFFLGQPLDYVKEKAGKYLSFAENLSYVDLQLCHSAMIRVVELLDPGPNDEESEPEFLAKIRDSKYTSVYAGYLIHRMLALYILGRHKEVEELSQEAAEVLHGIAGTIIWPDFYFIDGLNCIQLADEKRSYLKKAERHLKKLSVWSQASPVNYEVKYLLLSAEITARLNSFTEAFELYEQANLAAKVGGFLHLEAMVNEHAAKFWLSHGHEDYANIKMSLAYRAFQKWGAAKKNKQLMAAYPYIINTQFRRRKFTGKESHSGIESAQTFSETFDLATVMKSIQAISEKLVFEDLITEMLSIVVENAGAQVGHLLLSDRSDWHIEASYTDQDDQVVFKQKEISPQSTEIPHSIVQYVSRTKQSLLIQNAQERPEFSNDPYIATKSPKSILCLVLMRQDMLIGILYLENNQVIGAFTDERLQFMDLLCNQIAIAIDHARLYSNLENKVHERTAIIKHQNSRLQEQKKELDRQMPSPRPSKRICYRPPTGNNPSSHRLQVQTDDAHWGDFLDISYDPENERLGYFICDVSGHGVHAAMLAAMVKVSLHSWNRNLDNPVEVLRQIRTLLKGKMAGNFITASIGFIDLRTGQMANANAGHGNLCVLRKNGTTELINPKGRLIVSWLDMDCTEETGRLNPGDKIILFTDGLQDAQSKSSGALGEERLMAIIEDHRNKPPGALCDAVFGEVGKFFQGTEQNDDLTFLAIEYTGNGSEDNSNGEFVET